MALISWIKHSQGFARTFGGVLGTKYSNHWPQLGKHIIHFSSSNPAIDGWKSLKIFLGFVSSWFFLWPCDVASHPARDPLWSTFVVLWPMTEGVLNSLSDHNEWSWLIKSKVVTGIVASWCAPGNGTLMTDGCIYAPCQISISFEVKPCRILVVESICNLIGHHMPMS